MGVCKLLTNTLKSCLSGTLLCRTPIQPQWQPKKLRKFGDDYKTLFAAESVWGDCFGGADSCLYNIVTKCNAITYSQANEITDFLTEV